jgi:hypothetical protein
MACYQRFFSKLLERMFLFLAHMARRRRHKPQGMTVAIDGEDKNINIRSR